MNVFLVEGPEDLDRGLALYLSQRQCGLKLAALDGLVVGVDHAAVSNCLRKFESAHGEDPKLKRVQKQAL